MTAPKSLYSWDIIIKKYQDILFIDKRSEENILDLLTVNETSQDNQPVDDETINGVRQLMQEAVKVNNSWRYQQYIKDKKINLAEKDPFIEVEDQVAARLGYMYKIWDIGNKKKICIRSSVHSYLQKPGQEDPSVEGQPKPVYQNSYAFLEYEQNKSNWKQNLDMMMA
jgi:translation initiation factor 3 subunit D